jgi:hypothetical protein
MATPPTPPSGATTPARLGLAAALGLGLAGLALIGAGTLALTTVLVARTVVTPPRRRAEDTRVLAFDGSSVVLERTPDATVAGEYSLWFDGGRGHARVATSSRTRRRRSPGV